MLNTSATIGFKCFTDLGWISGFRFVLGGVIFSGFGDCSFSWRVLRSVSSLPPMLSFLCRSRDCICPFCSRFLRSSLSFFLGQSLTRCPIFPHARQPLSLGGVPSAIELGSNRYCL